MNTNEQAPECCPFCGAAMMSHGGNLMRSADGEYARYTCGNGFDARNASTREMQSSSCAEAERERLTRERAEARAEALVHLGNLLQAQDERDAALARVKRLEEAGEWQPIETAPTDKTWVIGCNSKDGEVGTIIFDLTGDAEDDDTHYEWTDGMRTWHPTHWMPIPDPPKAKEATP